MDSDDAREGGGGEATRVKARAPAIERRSRFSRHREALMAVILLVLGLTMARVLEGERW